MWTAAHFCKEFVLRCIVVILECARFCIFFSLKCVKSSVDRGRGTRSIRQCSPSASSRAAITKLLCDRNFKPPCFNAAGGNDPVLYQHFFVWAPRSLYSYTHRLWCYLSNDVYFFAQGEGYVVGKTVFPIGFSSLFITLRPRRERYKSLRALNTSPPRNHRTFL